MGLEIGIAGVAQGGRRERRDGAVPIAGGERLLAGGEIRVELAPKPGPGRHRRPSTCRSASFGWDRGCAVRNRFTGAARIPRLLVANRSPARSPHKPPSRRRMRERSSGAMDGCEAARSIALCAGDPCRFIVGQEGLGVADFRPVGIGVLGQLHKACGNSGSPFAALWPCRRRSRRHRARAAGSASTRSRSRIPSSACAGCCCSSSRSPRSSRIG